MATHWSKRKALITVRTYPVPATKGIEVSCTAAITESGEWLRLFPVPYRFLEEDKRFRKWQWIEVIVTKARDDPRPESFKLNAASIVIGPSVPSTDGWRARRAIVCPLMRPSLCSIQREQRDRGAPTLGFFKPGEIERLLIEPTAPDWTPKQMAILSQELLPFSANRPTQQLEKIPYDFRYVFRCAEASCKGHELTCFDWELGQSYRRWRRKYGQDWEKMFRQRYEYEMKEKYETHFFVGTMHQHPATWIIVGLFYPPRLAVSDLFN